MKKVLNCFLALAVLLSLTACSNSTSNDKANVPAITTLSLDSNADGVIITLPEIPTNATYAEIHCVKAGTDTLVSLIQLFIDTSKAMPKKITDYFVNQDGDYIYKISFYDDVYNLLAKSNFQVVKAKGGKGELSIINNPAATFISSNNTMSFTVIPEISTNILNFATEKQFDIDRRAMLYSPERGYFPSMNNVDSNTPLEIVQYDFAETIYGKTLDFAGFDISFTQDDMIRYRFDFMRQPSWNIPETITVNKPQN